MDKQQGQQPNGVNPGLMLEEEWTTLLDLGKKPYLKLTPSEHQTMQSLQEKGIRLFGDMFYRETSKRLEEAERTTAQKMAQIAQEFQESKSAFMDTFKQDMAEQGIVNAIRLMLVAQGLSVEGRPDTTERLLRESNDMTVDLGEGRIGYSIRKEGLTLPLAHILGVDKIQEIYIRTNSGNIYKLNYDGQLTDARKVQKTSKADIEMLTIGSTFGFKTIPAGKLDLSASIKELVLVSPRQRTNKQIQALTNGRANSIVSEFNSISSSQNL